MRERNVVNGESGGTFGILEIIERNNRTYRITDEVRESYEKRYNYVSYDMRLLNHAMDEYGGISDCYIMYAVAKLGLCDVGAIQNFLKAYKKKNPELNILDITRRGGLRKRLSVLFGQGFLFRHIYTITCRHPQKQDELVKNTIYVYSIDKVSQNFMTQKLGKRVPPNEWIQAKPIEEIVGWCAACHVGTKMAQHDNFVEFKEGLFKGRNIGTCYLPIELKLHTCNTDYYVAVMPAFLYRDKARITENDYIDGIIYKIKTIMSYFLFRNYGNKMGSVVVVVESGKDLLEFADMICDSQLLEEYYDRIFFTSEGVMEKYPAYMFRIKDDRKAGEERFECTLPRFFE